MLLLVALVQINLYIQLIGTTTTTTTTENVLPQPQAVGSSHIKSSLLFKRIPPQPRTAASQQTALISNDLNYPTQNCCSQRQSASNLSPTMASNDSDDNNINIDSASSQIARENKMDYSFNSNQIDSSPPSWSLENRPNSSDSDSSLNGRADYSMTVPNGDDNFPNNLLVEGVETFTNNHHNQWLASDNNNNNQEKQHNSRHYNKYQYGVLKHHHQYNIHLYANNNNKYSSIPPNGNQYNSNAFANNYNFNYIQNLLTRPNGNSNNHANSFAHSNSLLLNALPSNGLAASLAASSASSTPPTISHHQQQNSYINNNNNGLLVPYIPGSSMFNGGSNTKQHSQPASQPPTGAVSSASLNYSPSISTTSSNNNNLVVVESQQQQQQHNNNNNSSTVGELPGSTTCGRQQLAGYREPRIVGGNNTYEGEFPWAVSIQRHGNHHCGGVIVGRRWILTAAHCVRSQLVGNLLVRTGGSTLTRSANSLNSHLEHDYLVEQIVMHDDFSRYDNLTASQSKSSANTNNADIALLKLKHEIFLNEFAWPVCFPNKEAGNFSGHEAIVIGWGKLNEKSEDFSNDLQKVKLTIIDNKVCQNWFRQAGREMPIDDRIICAGFKSGGKDACHGDSGGPLLSRINGQYVVVGVVSTGIGCARPLLPGLYSRVSSYINWIEKYVV